VVGGREYPHMGVGGYPHVRGAGWGDWVVLGRFAEYVSDFNE
jgi:hypothetical protein